LEKLIKISLILKFIKVDKGIVRQIKTRKGIPPPSWKVILYLALRNIPISKISINISQKFS
jgi:hypothetical protein